VEYDDGTVIEYTYDAAGNRTRLVVHTGTGNQPPPAVPTPFAAFHITGAWMAKLAHRANTDQFLVWGSFDLADTSDGMNVLNEAVTVAFGGLRQTLPAGSFLRMGRTFHLHGASGGVRLMHIYEHGQFLVWASGLDLSQIVLPNPVSFSLQIGNDLGVMDIPFDREGRFRQ
jgi:hypothetical protein